MSVPDYITERFNARTGAKKLEVCNLRKRGEKIQRYQFIAWLDSSRNGIWNGVLEVKPKDARDPKKVCALVDDFANTCLLESGAPVPRNMQTTEMSGQRLDKERKRSAAERDMERRDIEQERVMKESKALLDAERAINTAREVPPFKNLDLGPGTIHYEREPWDDITMPNLGPSPFATPPRTNIETETEVEIVDDEDKPFDPKSEGNNKEKKPSKVGRFVKWVLVSMLGSLVSGIGWYIIDYYING